MNIISDTSKQVTKIEAPAVKLDIEEMEAAAPTGSDTLKEKEKSCLCHDAKSTSLMGTCVI